MSAAPRDEARAAAAAAAARLGTSGEALGRLLGRHPQHSLLIPLACVKPRPTSAHVGII